MRFPSSAARFGNRVLLEHGRIRFPEPGSLSKGMGTRNRVLLTRFQMTVRNRVGTVRTVSEPRSLDG